MPDDTFDQRFPSDPSVFAPSPPTPDPRTTLRNAMSPPPPPPREPPPSPYDARIEEANRKAEEHIEKAEKGFEEEQRGYERSNAELAPRRQALMAELDRPLPQHPRLRESPPAPQVDTEGAQSWIMASMLLGALAGAFTRNHVSNALGAMQGALDGYAAGSQIKFKQNMETWSAENKRAIEANENALNDYHEILADRKLTIEQKSIELQIAAQQHKDDAMATAARSKNELTIAQLYDKQAQAQQQLKDHATALSEKQAQETETHRHNVATEQAAAERARNTNRLGSQQLLSEDAIDTRARLALEGNPLAFRGMRAGSPDYAAVSNRFSELAHESGLSPEEITRRQAGFAGQQAYQRTAGGMGARVEMASNEVVQLAPQAVDASRAVPRGDVTPLNKLLQEGLSLHIPLLSQEMPIYLGQKQTSDPRYNDAAVALWSLSNAYGRAMNPQGVPRVTERYAADAMGLFSLANSQPALEAQIYRVLKEVESSKVATAKTRGVRDPEIEEIENTIRKLGLRPGSAYPQSSNRGVFTNRPGLPPPPPEVARGAKGDRMSALPGGWSSEQVG
jgi:hypothetical protein